MKKKILAMLCVGALAVGCLCGCGAGNGAGDGAGNEASGNEEVIGGAKDDSKEAADAVGGIASKGDKTPSFEGTVEGIHYQLWFDEDFESRSVAWIYTNTEQETVEIKGEVIFYNENGEVFDSKDLDTRCLEYNAPVADYTFVDQPLGNVEFKIEKVDSTASMGVDLVEIGSEVTEKGAKVSVTSISTDQVLSGSEMHMFFFKDGEFVRHEREVFGGEKLYDSLCPGETVTFEQSCDYEVDEVVCYFQCNGVIPEENVIY